MLIGFSIVFEAPLKLKEAFTWKELSHKIVKFRFFFLQRYFNIEAFNRS